jgi:hypothetical protein
MPDFQAAVCVRIQESEHVCLQVIADLTRHADIGPQTVKNHFLNEAKILFRE